MEQAIDKLRADIAEFLVKLRKKRKAFEESMAKDEVMANTRQILNEIKQFEASILAIVENHFKEERST